ncbi:MAG: hypothetical protein H8E55_01935 [Pelagibacterales bacterium]|nr:hypothetical protein [Pelagibacterales bacterium]
MSRDNFKINRNSHDYVRSERVNWLDEFVDNLEKSSRPKSAVEVARERSQTSVLDQISGIVGNKSTHATVESKVKELQDRVGLTEYLNRVSSDKESAKIASLDMNDAFDKFGPKMKDDIINFCRNKISTHRGQIAVPAVQHDILTTFKQYGLQPQDVDTDKVAECISNLIESELRNNPSTDISNPDLGKGVGVTDMDDDNSNSDFMAGLLPNS